MKTVLSMYTLLINTIYLSHSKQVAGVTFLGNTRYVSFRDKENRQNLIPEKFTDFIYQQELGAKLQ